MGIALGDITGIGPEVTLKALAAEGPSEGARYLLLGDVGHAQALNRRLGLNLPLQAYSGPEQRGWLAAWNPLPGPLPEDLPTGSPAAAQAAIAWLRAGT